MNRMRSYDNHDCLGLFGLVGWLLVVRKRCLVGWLFSSLFVCRIGWLVGWFWLSREVFGWLVGC